MRPTSGYNGPRMGPSGSKPKQKPKRKSGITSMKPKRPIATAKKRPAKKGYR